MEILKKIKNIKISDSTNKLNKTDWIIMGIMVLIYGILSFIRLGDTKAPNTYKTFEYEGDEVVVTLDKEYDIGRMRYYTGNSLGEIKIFSSIDGEDYQENQDIKIDSVFNWIDIELNIQAKYVKFVAKEGNATLGDVAFYDRNLVMLPIENAMDSPLTDELDLVPDDITFMNSTYFDEIYFARTAYEYLHGLDIYEWTHPPLGKLIMAIPIAIFGFSPFSYRLMGNLFGIMLIPVMYILAKRIFKNRKWALLAGLIMMFDNFHFAHTRIALVDGFQVTFILLSVLFMKQYMDLGKNDSFKKKAINLIFSGFFIGCAIDTKWNALYAGLGLAITFFIHLFKVYDVNLIQCFKKNFKVNKVVNCLAFLLIIPFAIYYLVFILFGKETSKITVIIYLSIIACLLLIKFLIFVNKDKYLRNLMLVSILSFIIIPIVLYILSYILFPTSSYFDRSLKGVIDMNEMMYNYHSSLDATHPFSSVWYEWPIMKNPVWLYSGSLNNLRLTITDIGNPAIWWFGIVAFIYLVISAFKKKDKINIFILIFILSTFIPYVFIGRLMFMYHYFITLPFVMLGIVSFIKWITEKIKNNRIYYGYIILIILTFIIFYPVVSGMPVDGDYIDSLRWFSQWYF